MAFTYKNTFRNTFHNHSRRNRQLAGDPSAGEHELNQQALHKSRASLNSPASFIGINDFRYSGITDETLTHNDKRKQSSSQGLLRWWLPEIISSCFSIAALIALIIVLRAYDGRGLDNLRLPHGLTLNGLIAVIATINRVALVAPVEAAMSQEVWLWFSSTRLGEKVRSRLEDLEISDGASRGAWGSFVFLWRGRGTRWLSHIGAIVVITSLGFGAFTQQLIAIVELPISNTSTDSLAPGNIPHSVLWMNSTGNPAENALSPILSTKAAIYNGMLNGGIAPLSASCPTGNCSFPITPTVAVCGECNEVSYVTSCNSTICQYTLSTGTVMNLPNWYAGDTTQGINFLVTPREFDIYGTRRLEVAAFDVFGAPYENSQRGWDNSSTISSACSLWMCVNALDVMTKNGAQTQRLVSTLAQTADVISTTEVSSATVINFASLPPEMNPLPGTRYSVGFFAYVALTSFVTPLANGSVYTLTSGHIPSSDTVEAIWNGTLNGLDGWIKNLALSMTNNIRISAPAYAPRYNGSAYKSGIRVRWEWLALPVAMVCLSILILGVVMVRTSKARVNAWKGSPLAYLMTDVDESIKESVSAEELSAYKGVEKAVGKRRVVLNDQPNGRLLFREAGQ